MLSTTPSPPLHIVTDAACILHRAGLFLMLTAIPPTCLTRQADSSKVGCKNRDCSPPPYTPPSSLCLLSLVAGRLMTSLGVKLLLDMRRAVRTNQDWDSERIFLQHNGYLLVRVVVSERPSISTQCLPESNSKMAPGEGGRGRIWVPQMRLTSFSLGHAFPPKSDQTRRYIFRIVSYKETQKNMSFNPSQHPVTS